MDWLMRKAGTTVWRLTMLLPVSWSVVGCASSVGAARQEVPAAARPNDRIRVVTQEPTDSVVGRLVSVSGADLVLDTERTSGPSNTHIISRDRIVSVEVRHEEAGSGGGVFHGLILGAAIGGVTAGIVGWAATQCDGCDDPGIGVVLSVPGALLGGLVGASVLSYEPEEWVPACLPDVR